MVTQKSCDPKRLSELLADQLPESQLNDAYAHLETCVECRTALESLAADEGVWRDLPRFLRQDEIDPSQPLSEFSVSTLFHGLTGCPATETVLEQLAPSDDPAMLGRLGEYEILEVLGNGGMGVVLKGYDGSLNRYVAVKTLSPHLASNATARKRFAREAKAAAAVVHQHVVAVHAVEGDAKLPYFVMQLVAGVSLQERIDTEAPMDLKDILRIGKQAAEGLAAAHAQGLVHRDIKPSNILLENGVERVLLTDFGLARAVDDASMTRSGVVAGTPQFMSPEQARGHAVDHRSDLFSLGNVLYEMCTGHSPFRADSALGVLRRISDEPHRPVRQLNADTPEWLEEIIDRLLAKDADQRIQSASEVAETLGAWLAHVQQPDVVPPPARNQRPTPSSGENRGRSPTVKLLMGAAFAFALILAGVFIVLELNKGTLTIESHADNVPVRIVQSDKVVEKLTVTRAGASVRVAAGKYVVEIDGETDGITVKGGAVSLQRGGREVVRIVRRDESPAGHSSLPLKEEETAQRIPAEREQPPGSVDSSDRLNEAIQLALAVLRGEDNERTRLMRAHFDREWEDDIERIQACQGHEQLAIDQLLADELVAFAITSPLKNDAGRHLLIEFAFERQTDGAWELKLIDIEPADNGQRDVDRFREEYPEAELLLPKNETLDPIAAEILAAVKENRAKLPSRAAIRWTRTANQMVEYRPKKPVELHGVYEMWWDGPRVATRNMTDTVVVGPGKKWTVERSGFRTAYDGNEFRSIENVSEPRRLERLEMPEYRLHVNWLKIIRWTELPDFQSSRDRRDLKVAWNMVDRDGRQVARRAVTNATGNVISVEYYDPGRGGEFLGHEWYNDDSQLYSTSEVVLQQINGGAWFPIQIDQRSLDVKTDQPQVQLRFLFETRASSFGVDSLIEESYFEELPPFDALR